MTISAPARRYTLTVIVLMTGYVLALSGAVGFFKSGGAHGLVAYFAAVLPALPIVGVFLAIGRYLATEPDEYLRMLEVRKALVATDFALSAATVWGFLEMFELVAHVDSYWIAVLWFGGLFVGMLVNRLAAPETVA